MTVHEVVEPDDKLAFRFFRNFARLEYALKAAGFHNNDDGPAKPNWICFADTFGSALNDLESNEFGESIAYMLGNPPRQQMVNSRRLKWQDSQPERTTARTLAKYVKCVRNNLFHGGKLFEPLSPRDRLLLDHSLKILDAFVETSADVKHAYFDGDDAQSK